MAITLALPLLVACNALIGLSDFEKGNCSGGEPCANEGGQPDQLVEAGPDVRADVQADVKGADPTAWPRWPMPNYGEAGPGEPPRAPKLTLTGDTVTDGVTGLAWRSTLLPTEVTLREVASECAKVPNGPWRAPKRIELVTLLDYSRKSPFIDTTKFTNVLNDKVWTTSEVRPFVADKPDQPYWVVNFETGAVEPLRADFKANVLCVRAK